MGSAGIGMMYDNFNIVADACRRTGRDFWFIPQCNGRNEDDFTNAFDQVSAGRSKKPWITTYNSECSKPHWNQGIHI